MVISVRMCPKSGHVDQFFLRILEDDLEED